MTRYAISYLRFSSPKQKWGDSERRQFAVTKKWAEEDSIDLDETLVDRGLSGRGAHRQKGFWGKLIQRIEDGDIAHDAIIFVEALDRMSREKPRIAMTGFLDLINLGIEIRTTIDHQIHTAASIDADKGSLSRTLGKMEQASDFIEMLSYRTKEAHAENRGKPSDVCPAWIRQNPATPTGYEIRPECQSVIDDIFRLCIAGYGLDRIASHLNTNQVPTFASRKRQSAGWYDVYLRKIITGRSILGEVTYHEMKDKVRVPLGIKAIKYPPAVSDGTWQAANDALAGRRGDGGKHIAHLANLFQGMTYCHCGARMRIRDRPATKGRGAHCFLQCRDAKRGQCVHKTNHSYPPIEKAILGTFATTVYEVTDKTDHQTAMLNRIATAKHEADELRVAFREAHRFAMKHPGPLADEGLAETQAEHAAKVKEVDDLESLLRKMKRVDTASDQLDELRAMISAGDLTGDVRTKLNADFRKYIRAIVFKPNGEVAIKLGQGGSIHLSANARMIHLSDDVPAGAIELTTAEEIMAASQAGDLVGCVKS